MSQVLRIGAGLGALAVAALAACPFPLATQVPMRHSELRAHAGERSDTVAILLQGHGDAPQEFVRHGFVAEIEAAGVDVILADAHSGYYAEQSTETRLWTDVVAPARAAGYARVWLVGLSMGGMGAIWTASMHPGEISGVVLMAPYLGRRRTLKPIEETGVEQWQPQAEAGPWDYEIWRWLKQASAAKNPPIFLAYGTEDGDRGRALLGRMLPPERVFTRPGGHDWQTWTALWHVMAPKVPWRGEDPRLPGAGPVLRTADELCQDKGFDFAYDPAGVPVEGSGELGCGFGPGTACVEETSDAYCDGAAMVACVRGKLAATNCVQHCRQVGDPEGTPRDSGRCAIRRDEAACVCCDREQPGCLL
ncbi:alpha/beta fold hydrolase [Nannocystis bainbridge]|uniref:Alpha/beta hydrolase n=1 Tax=Nannocystis bainbridge TaxID=2995303 RepID=A0ABT5DVF4_9BACT|nr:alpha/beta hydrolase [Nannocystis bainbridge]MDC0717054.1 alpha/beta hydrolase [Nannocystis bainbridge]